MTPLYGGRRFLTLNVLDEGNREGLPIEVGTLIANRLPRKPRTGAVHPTFFVCRRAPRQLDPSSLGRRRRPN